MTRHDPFASINQTHICHGESQTKPKGYPSGPAMQCNAMRCEPLCASHVEDKTSNRWVGKACSITMPHMMYIRRYMSSDQPAIPTAAHALTHTVVARPWFGCMPPTQSAIRWTAIDAMHPPLAFVRAGHTSDRCTYVLAGGILSF